MDDLRIVGFISIFAAMMLSIVSNFNSLNNDEECIDTKSLFIGDDPYCAQIVMVMSSSALYDYCVQCSLIC
jgi:hypothetical protein